MRRLWGVSALALTLLLPSVARAGDDRSHHDWHGGWHHDTHDGSHWTPDFGNHSGRHHGWHGGEHHDEHDYGQHSREWRADSRGYRGYRTWSPRPSWSYAPYPPAYGYSRHRSWSHRGDRFHR